MTTQDIIGNDHIPAHTKEKMIMRRQESQAREKLDAETKEFIHNNKVLISYVRGPEIVSLKKKRFFTNIPLYYVDHQLGPIKAVIVATGKDKIGWSKVKKGDKYNKYEGIQIALSHIEVESPYSLNEDVEKMRVRATKYFKDQP